MARHIIKTEVLRRFIKIPTYFEPSTTDVLKKEISVIRLEIKKGNQFIIATNQQIAVAELVGKTDSVDDVCYLKPSKSLRDFLDLQIDADFIVETIPDLAMASAVCGIYVDYEPCAWFDNNIMDSWRSWFGTGVKKSVEDPMLWDLFHLTTLFESSPSGKIVFPAHIDPHKPVVVRDYNKDNWCGVFIPDDKRSIVKEAEKPEWI